MTVPTPAGSNGVEDWLMVTSKLPAAKDFGRLSPWYGFKINPVIPNSIEINDTTKKSISAKNLFIHMFLFIILLY
ncbi:MAG: hypothetical protein H7196_04335 [candidate division SR1 bacterium]|nr:hypothetical protein [candidate division SR1 bacterium]